ncbi:MAG: flagellar hook-associated protein FlgK [Candidatus Nitrospinota bacterium M3_3B_026]
MPNVYGALNIAKMSLLTHQIALDVTGQNISNVNNPDFTRQQLQLEAAFPIQPGGVPGMIGTGVRATSIVRHYDQFLEGQRLTNSSTTAYWDAKQDFLSRLEVVFNESSEKGLNNLFDQFFLSWRNLAFNPRGLTERTDVISQGRNMATFFNKLNQDMKNLREDLDTKVTSTVTEINRLSSEVVRMNQMIHETEVFGVHANDFRDKREALIRELSGYVDVNVVEDSNNEVMVTMKGGRPLVIGQTAFELTTRVRSDDPLASDVYWNDASGTSYDITSEIQDGAMASWIYMRDTEVAGYIDKLDLLAATMARDINSLHGEGFGLDGSTGQDFFSGLSVGVSNGRDNQGTGAIGTGTIVDPGNVNLHKFQVTYNGGNLVIQDRSNGTTVATEAYVSGNNINYFLGQGIQVAITGAPQDGDTFTVNAAQDASINMSVNSALVTDPNKVAAGLTTTQGDGDNALRIAQVQSEMTMNKATAAASGTATFAEYYNSMVGQVGVSAKEADSTYNQQELINFELDNRREQVAGVSLDEEMVNLIKNQHAYQASARLVGVLDELLQTLVALGR